MSAQPRIIEKKKATKSRLPNIVTNLDWLWTLLIAIAWNSSLALMLMAKFGDPTYAAISSTTYILAITICLFLYPPYTSKWRTIGWSYIISMGCSWLVTFVPQLTVTSSYAATVVPVSIFVFLRCNQNFRKIKYTYLNKKSSKEK